MIEDRVGELHVRVRTDVQEVEAVRSAAERMVRSVLQRCAAILEERAPGRVILLRHLPLHFQCDETVLEDPDQMEDLAQTTADAIERIAVPSTLQSLAALNHEAVVFEDESQLRAAHLLAIARAQPVWFHAMLAEAEPGGPLAALAVPTRRTTAHATLERLARAGVLAEMLAVQPASAVAVLAAALGFETPQLAANAHAPPVEAGPSPFEPSRQLAELASDWPVMNRSARSLALHVHAAVHLGVGVDSPEADALAAATAAILQSRTASPAEIADSLGRGSADADESREAASAVPHAERAGTAKMGGVGGTAAESTPISTRCGGLFYLLNCVLELDLAECLWTACLPEGALLASASAALLGDDFAQDPAPWLFGGVGTGVVCPDVTPEQLAEIATATCAALVAALPRRELAEIPTAYVTLAEHPAGRLLVAAAQDSPFAFLAWPASTPEMLRAGLDALLDAWPHTASLFAAPALATFDTSGRLQPRSDLPPIGLLLPRAESAAVAALLALLIGAPCALFGARAGFSGGNTAHAFVAKYLARPAQLQMTADGMQVHLDADAADLEVRRAALDRDPGWVPWLNRHVSFVYGD